MSRRETNPPLAPDNLRFREGAKAPIGERVGMAAVGFFGGLAVGAFGLMLWIAGGSFVASWRNGSDTEHVIAVAVAILGALGAVVGWRCKVEMPARSYLTPPMRPMNARHRDRRRAR